MVHPHGGCWTGRVHHHRRGERADRSPRHLGAAGGMPTGRALPDRNPAWSRHTMSVTCPAAAWSTRPHRDRRCSSARLRPQTEHPRAQMTESVLDGTMQPQRSRSSSHWKGLGVRLGVDRLRDWDTRLSPISDVFRSIGRIKESAVFFANEWAWQGSRRLGGGRGDHKPGRHPGFHHDR